jgi:hypothetical protein
LAQIVITFFAGNIVKNDRLAKTNLGRQKKPNTVATSMIGWPTQ